MSLLKQDQQKLDDDAAHGEALTKGTSHIVWASILAAVVMVIGATVFVISQHKPPMATGEITRIWVHPQHTMPSTVDANGAPIPEHSGNDQVLVFVEVHLHNQSKVPLFLQHVTTNTTMPDGIRSSYAAPASDYERVFLAYPQLNEIHGKAMPTTEATIDPGKTLEGNLVCAFQMSKQEWDARKDLNLTFTFRYQPGLVLTTTVAAIEK